MQIKINLQIFLFLIVFILTNQIEVYSWTMLFALIHELGHMTAGLILKLKPKNICLMPFGISITFEDYGYKKLLEIKKILIALSGPFVNILIALISIVLKLSETIIYINILIAIFNLIPLYPLDGGRILKGIIRIRKSKQRADEMVNKISNLLLLAITAISSILVLYIKNIAIVFVITYLWIIVINENKRYNMKKMMYNIINKTKVPKYN